MQVDPPRQGGPGGEAAQFCLQLLGDRRGYDPGAGPLWGRGSWRWDFRPQPLVPDQVQPRCGKKVYPNPETSWSPCMHAFIHSSIHPLIHSIFKEFQI